MHIIQPPHAVDTSWHSRNSLATPRFSLNNPYAYLGDAVRF